jgi:acyl-CoA thioesterase I
MEPSMMRVLVAGDSLSMARHADGVGYPEIYPVRLQLAFPGDIVINASLRGNSSEEIAAERYLVEHLRPLRPTHVVLQIGIVDCTPRLFGQREKLLLSAMDRVPGVRALSRAVIDHASRHRYAITRLRRMCQVPVDRFERSLQAFAASACDGNPQCTFSVVNIPCPTDVFVRSNYRVAEIIVQYNGILARLAGELRAGLVDLYDYTRRNPASLLSDGYHLAVPAHDFLFDQLRSRLRHLIPRPE